MRVMEGVNDTFLSALFSRPSPEYFISNGILIMLLPLFKLLDNLLLLFRWKLIFLMCSIVSCLVWPSMTSLISTHSEIPHSALCTSVRVAFFQQPQCTLLSLITGPLHLLLQLSEMLFPLFFRYLGSHLFWGKLRASLFRWNQMLSAVQQLTYI